MLYRRRQRRLGYNFTDPWSDGTTGMRLSPMELVEKLAALVPRQRVHLVRQREQSGMGWADAVGGKGRLIFLYSYSER